MIICGIDPSINGSGVVKLQLDKKLKIQHKEFLAFSTVKKNSKKNKYGEIISYKKSDFKNDILQNNWMIENISLFVKDSTYIAIEDYALNAQGRIFNIAEFVGCLKRVLLLDGFKLRLYEPTVIKKFATENGLADKIRMEDTYHKTTDELDLKNLDIPQYKSPKSDIIDAFYISKLLQLELKMRYGLLNLQQLTLKQIEIFNTVSKHNKVNLLARDFLEK